MDFDKVRKHLYSIILILLITVTLIWVVYGVVGVKLIRTIYDSDYRYLSLFIQGRAEHQCNYYIDFVQQCLWGMTWWVVVGSVWVVVGCLLFRKSYVGAVIFNIIIILLIGELSTFMIFKQLSLVKKLPEPLLWYVRQIYSAERHLSALRKNMRYDPVVSYTLQPGAFTLSECEFTNKYSTNSLGLRDDEASLDKPVVVMLGDSHTMGFGVDQQKTFAQRIEKATGLKVLNAGLSSYATVREMRMLDRIDTSNLKYLFIQYCSNDIFENQKFYNLGDLHIMSEQEHNKKVYERVLEERYYLGKYMGIVFRKLLSDIDKWQYGLYLSIFGGAEYEHSAKLKQEASAFLYAIYNAGHKDLRPFKIFLFALNEYNDNNPRFINAVQQLARKYPQLTNNVAFIDLSPYLRKEHYYTLDDHMNERGHKVVADRLIELIESFEAKDD